ncbi:MAG: tRNA (adenosine(37)-N6)-dimethylallyltransferase MiaA [Candidatus Moranbacteria bacterium]|nr:tRNA (adenosine(37)-N6)-dimethylallyltransferase MiaA [Candidatus Moranbacteria bacterium]
MSKILPKNTFSQEQRKTFLLAILGPTASGKSDVAIQIAKKYNGEIISCDSRQIYRGMDIGSGKVKRDSFETNTRPIFLSETIPHHLIDIVSPKTEYNVVKFQKQARIALQNILSRKKLPILCGGTGFWAQALLENQIFPEISPDKKLRKILEKKSREELLEKLISLNPQRALSLDTSNPLKIIRALEIISHEKTSSKNTYFSRETKPLPIWEGIIINPPREILYKNIEIRLDQRFEEGMIDEVKGLHYNQKIPWKRLESFGLEYRWITQYLLKKVSLEEMKEGLFQDIRHYAKRQGTWFRRWERQGRIFSWVNSKEESLCRAKEILAKYL